MQKFTQVPILKDLGLVKLQHWSLKHRIFSGKLVSLVTELDSLLRKASQP